MIDQHAAQAGINARNMPGLYGQFVTEYNQRIATENAVTAQAKRLILEDMVVDRLELGGQLIGPTTDRVFEFKKSDVGHAGRANAETHVVAGYELSGLDEIAEATAEGRDIPFPAGLNVAGAARRADIDIGSQPQEYDAFQNRLRQRLKDSDVTTLAEMTEVMNTLADQVALEKKNVRMFGTANDLELGAIAVLNGIGRTANEMAGEIDLGQAVGAASLLDKFEELDRARDAGVPRDQIELLKRTRAPGDKAVFFNQYWDASPERRRDFKTRLNKEIADQFSEFIGEKRDAAEFPRDAIVQAAIDADTSEARAKFIEMAPLRYSATVTTEGVVKASPAIVIGIATGGGFVMNMLTGVSEAFRAAKVNVDNPEALLVAMRGPAVVAKAREKLVEKAAATAFFDAVTGAVSGGIVKVGKVTGAEKAMVNIAGGTSGAAATEAALGKKPSVQSTVETAGTEATKAWVSSVMEKILSAITSGR